MYWKYYLPSLVSISLGLFFLWIPSLAVALVVGGFLGFGVFYAVFISKIIQAKVEANFGRPPGQEPTFRHVTVSIVKKSNWFRE
ncbi:hypothetical protein WDW86_00625 [Bdellovibrionota bacterium FG-2]